MSRIRELKNSKTSAEIKLVYFLMSRIRKLKNSKTSAA